MGQRVMMADEPTSALDVTEQIKALRISGRLVTDRGMGLIFISHDLRRVGSFCGRVLVMYGGRVMEKVKATGQMRALHPCPRAR
jgi:peptide/nickel transport system ATP-binding protein